MRSRSQAIAYSPILRGTSASAVASVSAADLTPESNPGRELSLLHRERAMNVGRPDMWPAALPISPKRVMHQLPGERTVLSDDGEVDRSNAP